ncbi:flavocytochrome c [Brevibacillus daliensis]|uniref:flavocytochrome c n=1 Tax=Brevibacillus daliensis TaxID=2892995 RepID=UPI001E3232F5|nr:flavocytochrome c [Brevibacillus daliensis]
MKKFFTWLLIMILSLSLTACGTSVGSGSATSTIKDGTYTGEGIGKGGPIKVEVTIKDDTITGIKVVSHSETEGLDKSMDTLTENILKTNSADQDAISGCTLTSKGFLEAVNAAIASAGATPDMLKKIDGNVGVTTEKKNVEETRDIVIIGAGGAGFNAAIEAKMAGSDVLIIEKLPVAGGNTLISGAEYAAPGNWLQKKENISDNPQLMIEDTLKGGDHKNDPELVKTVAENALDGAVWLRDVVGVEWEDELMFFGGHSVKRSLIPLGASGQEIIKKQLAKAEELNIPIYYDTPATELITDKSGKVVGVKAEGTDTNYTIHTNKAVIIATGGFGSNIEMRKKYNPDIDETILSTNSVGSTGDGIVMAEKIGAALTGMEYIQTYPICDPLTGTLLYYDDARLYGHTVIVNKEGKRFVEELGRRDVMSMAIKAQTGHAAYELIDHNGFVESKLQENHAAELDYLYKNDLLVKADTLDEVAAFFEIEAEELKKTVTNYNSYVDAGKDPEFNKRSLPSKIEKGPFYMIKAVPAVHHTMGGIKINPNAQVINTEGKVIEGLYAAGEVTGGIHGTNRLGSNALADITVFGRIAGQNAAK